MINHPRGATNLSAIDLNATNLRLLLPETLWLEPEHFEQARECSHLFSDEKQQWQAYLNALATLAFAAWLKERLPDYSPQRISNSFTDIGYLKIDEFKLCLIATEHVLDEAVSIPRIALEQTDLIAHFYIVLEVLEDQEQVVVRGFLRYDELTPQFNRIAPSQPGNLCFPLSIFDPEPNHLTVYIQYLEPSAIPLPTSTQPGETLPRFGALRTRLSQWLQGVLDEGWQTVDALVNPEANLAWSTRHIASSAKGGKLINFGMQLGSQTVVLLVTVTSEDEGKIGINVQVLPAAGAEILPAQLQLTLLSNANKILQDVQSRDHDNLIQLKPFKGKPGTGFSIEVSFNDIKVRETFEL